MELYVLVDQLFLITEGSPVDSSRASSRTVWSVTEQVTVIGALVKILLIPFASLPIALLSLPSVHKSPNQGESVPVEK